MSVESWTELRDALRACHDFLETAVEAVHVESGEEVGRMHAARLLGHVTDAMLIATWIEGVAIAARGAGLVEDEP